jgi:glyoxylase I family protein
LNIYQELYQNILGLPLALDSPDLIIFQAGIVFIAFRKANLKQESEAKFKPLGIGMDHLAISCETEGELNRFTKGLADAGIENTGVKFDDILQKKYVALKTLTGFSGNFIWSNDLLITLLNIYAQ